MEKNSTPISDPQKRVRRIYAQPSKATLDFLKNFARTYSPNEDLPVKKFKIVFN